jgi:hypothetical protein
MEQRKMLRIIGRLNDRPLMVLNGHVAKGRMLSGSPLAVHVATGACALITAFGKFGKLQALNDCIGS